MLQLILFAMIGTAIDASAGYWIVYGISAILWVIRAILNFAKLIIDKLDD